MMTRHLRPQERPMTLVITPMTPDGRIPNFPGLADYHDVDDSDWLVFPQENWRALADGDPQLWEEFERKLLITCFIEQPDCIAVIGHGLDDSHPDFDNARHQILGIVDRIAECCLSVRIVGYWAAPGEPVAPLDAEEVELNEALAF